MTAGDCSACFCWSAQPVQSVYKSLWVWVWGMQCCMPSLSSSSQLAVCSQWWSRGTRKLTNNTRAFCAWRGRSAVPGLHDHCMQDTWQKHGVSVTEFGLLGFQKHLPPHPSCLRPIEVSLTANHTRTTCTMTCDNASTKGLGWFVGLSVVAILSDKSSMK